MPSLEEVRRELDKDELDYPALAAEYGTEVLPQLRELVAEDQPRIAPKAAYLAGIIGGAASADVVSLASQSRHDVVRVAAASVLAELPQADAIQIATGLIKDPDPGIRIQVIKAATQLNAPALQESVRELQESDTDATVRAIAVEMAAPIAAVPRAHQQGAS